jgi:Uma2 family endonuclease
MTAEEFLEIPPDGKRYELINGEFVAHSSSSAKNGRSSLVRNTLRRRRTSSSRSSPMRRDNSMNAVKIYRRVGDSFVPTETGGTITSPLLPGFTLDVNVVFDV